MAVGGRREARERALSLLYEAEMKDASEADVLAALPLEPDAYALDLVRGVGSRQEALDELISRFARDWDVSRMPAVDRIVMRMAAYELLERPDVPPAVVLSEAVELAKRYSTEGSGRFVNGVLSSIAAEVRPE